MGDSGTGKTGALASLAGAGYKIRILDMDNKVGEGILPKAIKKDHPDKLGAVDFMSFRDLYKSTAAGPMFDGTPKAFVEAMAAMDKWEDGTVPKDWGVETVFVLDSLTFFADAAFNWARSMNMGAKDPRQWYGTAQDAVEKCIATLTSKAWNVNVIVICHVSWVNRPDGTMKGYPATIGQALGPTIPAYFDNMVVCQTGAGNKRTIQTIPTAMIDVKNAASFTMPPTLPLETGLAEIFKQLRS